MNSTSPRSQRFGTLLAGVAGSLLTLLLMTLCDRASASPETTGARATLTVVLSSGDTLDAIRVVPSGLDVVRIDTADRSVFYPGVRVRLIQDEWGEDRTRDILDRRQTLELGSRERRERASRSHALCWRGQPAPKCRSFMIVESGLLVRLDDDRNDSRVSVVFDLGWMKNVSPKEAVGFTGYAMASDVSRLGIRGRYRRWLSNRTSVDVSPGILLGGEGGGIGTYSPPGVVLGATFNAGDLFALTVDAEWARGKEIVDYTPPVEWQTRSDVAWRAGAKLGSSLGLLGYAAFAALVIAIITSGVAD